jgi:SAM-dependent methyltransferase
MSLFGGVVRSVTVPPHLKRIYPRFRDRPFTLLDIGCGYNAPSKVKKYLPQCEYHGIDLEMVGLDDDDRRFMRRFYQVNLEHDSLSDIPDAYFDAIVMSHVIEHLRNGVHALERLVGKLKPGGFIYVEFPGLGSLSAPSTRKGFLHFSDDPTHVRLYSTQEVVNALLGRGLTIVSAGTRRDRLRLMLTPALLLRGALQGDVWSGRPWDFFGIADYVFAQRPPVATGVLTT